MGLDWYLKEDPERAPFYGFVGELGRLYKRHACLWSSDPDPEGFQWITCHDRENSVVAYERRLPDGASPEPGHSEHLVVVLNLTPVPREGYRMGAPRAGAYRAILSTDDERFGGSGYPASAEVVTDGDRPWDGYHQSMVLTLPPLAALVLAPAPVKKPRSKTKAKSP